MKTKRFYLPDIVGKGYGTFWNFKGRYRVCKGSRASKKSKTTALWYIVNMMKYPKANTLVVRKTASSLKGSCFTELKWAIQRLGVEKYWKLNNSTLEMTYLPTGQKIYFRGMDDPLKITSITVDVGVLCWMWIEEAYEIMNESEFDTLDESIRGITEDGLFKQITLTFNPWSDQHWIKRRFFDVVDDNILAITTNYMCNEWLDPSDLKLFEDMRINRPKRYEVAGLGNWGISEGVIFDNWHVEDLSELIPTFSNIYHGLDFGATDPNAFVSFDYEAGQKKIYVFDEYYQNNITIATLVEEVRKRIGDRYVTCDSAGKQIILELNDKEIWALPSIKGPDSVNFGIQWLQDYEIIIHKDCVNFIREISNYRWATDKFDKPLNKPVDADNHLMDALRYGAENLMFDTTASSARRL